MHRITIFIGVLLAAALASPGSAPASSLLSGYGGPGQGNQAILGSALLNGPKGGGGSGGSGGSGSSSSGSATVSGVSTTTSAGTEASSRGSGASPPGGNGSAGVRHGSSRHTGGRSLHVTTTTSPQSLYPVAERIPSGAQDGTLGLSGADFLYIILAVGVLVSLGVLTRRVGVAARQQGHGG